MTPKNKHVHLSVHVDPETNKGLTFSAKKFGRSKRSEALCVLQVFYRLPRDKQIELLTPK